MNENLINSEIEKLSNIIKIPLGTHTTMTSDWIRPKNDEFIFCPKCGFDATLWRSTDIDYESGATFICINCRHTFLAFPEISHADGYDNMNIDYINKVTVGGRYVPTETTASV